MALLSFSTNPKQTSQRLAISRRKIYFHFPLFWSICGFFRENKATLPLSRVTKICPLRTDLLFTKEHSDQEKTYRTTASSLMLENDLSFQSELQ